MGVGLGEEMGVSNNNVHRSPAALKAMQSAAGPTLGHKGILAQASPMIPTGPKAKEEEVANLYFYSKWEEPWEIKQYD